MTGPPGAMVERPRRVTGTTTVRDRLALGGRFGLGDRLAFDAFRSDTRAIEGLPVRLVVALVVGVASLSVMMNMITGIQGLAVTELDVRPQPEVVDPGTESFTVDVVDPNGDPVADATVVLKGGTASVDRIANATTGDDGTATLEASPELRPNQDEGTLVLSVKPPAGSQYVDRRENTKVLVIRK